MGKKWDSVESQLINGFYSVKIKTICERGSLNSINYVQSVFEEALPKKLKPFSRYISNILATIEGAVGSARYLTNERNDLTKKITALTNRLAKCEDKLSALTHNKKDKKTGN